MQKDQPERSASATVACKEEASEVICYRFKCAESGNGLSHYIMYGDIPPEITNE